MHELQLQFRRRIEGAKDKRSRDDNAQSDGYRELGSRAKHDTFSRWSNRLIQNVFEGNGRSPNSIFIIESAESKFEF